MNVDNNLNEFAEAVKRALKSDGLWEYLKKQPGIKLPKDSHNFLRSVENIKVGRGPLNDFRLLKALLGFLQWSPAKLFGLVNNSVKEYVKKIPTEKAVEDPVVTQVERALRRLEAQIEVKSIKTKEPRQKRSPGSRRRIFVVLAARAIRTIFASQNRLEWVFSEKQLFYGLTFLKPNYFGHFGKSFEYIDRMLAHSIELGNFKPLERSIEFELRLLACYQLTTLHTFLEPFEKNLLNPSGKNFQCLGGQEFEALFLHLLGFLPLLLEEIVKQEEENQRIPEQNLKKLFSACFRIQEVLHVVSSVSVISPSIPSLENLTVIEKRNILLGKAMNMDRFKDNAEVLNLQPWWLIRAAVALGGLHYSLAPSLKPALSDFLNRFDISYDDLQAEVSQQGIDQIQFNYHYIALASEIVDLALLVRSPKGKDSEVKDEPMKDKDVRQQDTPVSPATADVIEQPEMSGNIMVQLNAPWTNFFTTLESPEEDGYLFDGAYMDPFTKKTRSPHVFADNGEKISPPRRTGNKSGDNTET